MTTFFEEELNCPCCGEIVKVKNVGSFSSMGQHTDLQVSSMGYSIYVISINTCMECGFSGSTDVFNIEIGEELRTQIKEVITPMLKEEALMNAGYKYELYGKIHELAGGDEFSLANIYLKGAWAASSEKTDNEKKLRSLAIKYFCESLQNNTVPLAAEADITYLIGELYRRINEKESADKWFNKVIKNSGADEKWEAVAKLAKRQRDNPTELI